MFTFHNHLTDRITLNLNHGFVVLLNIMEKPIQTYTHILLLMVKKIRSVCLLTYRKRLNVLITTL